MNSIFDFLKDIYIVSNQYINDNIEFHNPDRSIHLAAMYHFLLKPAELWNRFQIQMFYVDRNFCIIDDGLTCVILYLFLPKLFVSSAVAAFNKLQTQKYFWTTVANKLAVSYYCFKLIDWNRDWLSFEVILCNHGLSVP